jgi:foldase protein PrsA
MSYVSRALAGLATATFALSLTACGSGSGGGDVASVNGQKITRAEFDAKVDSTPQAKGVLNQMAQSILIDQYAKDNKINIPDADVKKKEDEIKARYPAGQFEQILKSQNLTEADVQRILRQQLVVEKAVAPQVHISDADVNAFLQKNHASLDTQEQVRARHILVANGPNPLVAPPLALEIEAKLKGGAKFEDLAKQYSTDPSTKDKGGELGFFSKTQMVPTFSSAAFSQKIGAIGPPVKSPFGWHIIQTEEHKPATVATMANSGDKIRTQLTQQQESTQIPQFLNTLKAKANIQIFDPAMKDAIPTPLPTAIPVPVPSAAAKPAATSAAAPTPAAKK